MKITRCLFLSAGILAGCSSANYQTPKTISYTEAAAFENSLLAQPTAPLKRPERHYTQPVNKKAPCKVPITQALLAHPHSRVYWDGECQNGFAYGLGREISISDEHQFDEITIHSGSGDDWSQPQVDYNYVDNTVQYRVGGIQYPAQTMSQQQFSDTMSGFDLVTTVWVIDEIGQLYSMKSSPFHTQKFILNANAGNTIHYLYTDNTTLTKINPYNVAFSAEILDPKTNMANGVSAVQYGSGVVRQFEFIAGKPQPVTLPAAYARHLEEVYQKTVQELNHADNNLREATKIEREYLYKACRGKRKIAGLDKSIYQKICTWRDQFKKPYLAAQQRYQNELAGYRQQAIAQTQRVQNQQRLAMQQQMVQQQQQQQQQQLYNQLNQTNQQLQQNNQRLMQQINSWRPPQVNPITPPGGYRTSCITVGRVTNCR